MVVVMARSELVLSFTPAACGRMADALASLGVLDRTYSHSQVFLDAYETALARVPSPSPFVITAPDFEELSPFLQGDDAHASCEADCEHCAWVRLAPVESVEHVVPL